MHPENLFLDKVLMFSPCILIPCFNHRAVIAETIQTVLRLKLPIIIVDDGSDAETQRILEDIVKKNGQIIHLFRFNENQGKGCAVIYGFHKAAELGCTHAVQIDADGQHTLSDIPKLLERARAKPRCLVSGLPVYDKSVPKFRYYGRYLTHFWVCVETLSFRIKDSMCGFRVYPLAETLSTVKHYRIGKRMDFDTDIMVHMYWDRVAVDFVPTRVIYPQDGVSHFRLFRDNYLISRMHVKLIIGMFLRIPGLVLRKYVKYPVVHKHWSMQREKGTYLGLKFLYLIYHWFGMRVFSIFLHPIILFFFLTSPDKRRVSKQYLERVSKMKGEDREISWYDSYRHFIAFGSSALDKIIAWMERDELSVAQFHGKQELKRIESSDKGVVLLGSHLGNLEYCRALSRYAIGKKVNAVVFSDHAANFNRILKEINPAFNINLIQVSSIGAETAILFREKINRGEILVIVGDRTSPFAMSRNIWVDFLGQKAPFPQGPFILASLMECPVYLFFCLKEHDGYHIYLEAFRDEMKLPRTTRNRLLKETIQDYAKRVEALCLKAPQQWFNFYDFWHEAAT